MEEGCDLDPQGLPRSLRTEDMIVEMSREESREVYSKLRNEREKSTFSMMMKMNPEALTAVRKEFFMREDRVKLPEFIYIIQRHLSGGAQTLEKDFHAMDTDEKREFGLNMCELFKEIDVNGDGDLEWQEFTQFIVEKANILNRRLKMTSIAHYSENTDSMDSTIMHRHRHDVTSMLNIAPLGLIALVEEHKNQIFILNTAKGHYVRHSNGDIKTDAAPIAISYVEENHTLVASLSNMTICTYSLDHPNPNKKYQTLSTWASPGVQMSVTYMANNKLLYSGATNGDIYSWRIKERKIYDTLSGHTDMVMSLVTLPNLNYLASASLDKSVSVWDAYTNQQLQRLNGHRKGILDIDYSTSYRLLVTAGFEHDAFIWSPFVNTIVYRLKGHHQSLVGCQAVEGTPEIITADSSGVVKLWDIRTFQCVQSFDVNLSEQEVKGGSTLGSFLHCNIPCSVPNQEDDSRIYAGSKVLLAFDQMRMVRDTTTDYSNVLWVFWDVARMMVITVSEKNVMFWDALLGSKTSVVANICGREISACCLDERKKKIVIGDVSGAIGVYNAASGSLIKSATHDVFSLVAGLQYIDNLKRFIAAYKNGILRLYDESGAEDCRLLMSFETPHNGSEVLSMVCNPSDYSVVTVGTSFDTIILWEYGTGKLEKEVAVCNGTGSEHVVHVTCLLPYPIVATSDSSGNILLFGTRGCSWAGRRIAGFLSQTPSTAEYEPQTVRSKGSDDSPQRAVIPDIGSTEPSERSEKGDSRARRGSFEEYHSDGSDEDSEESCEEEEGWRTALETLDRRASEDAVRRLMVDSEAKWGKGAPALAMGWEEKTMQMYVGDGLGNLRCFCLKDLILDMKGTFESKTRRKKRSAVGDRCKKHFKHRLSALPPIPEKGRSYVLGRANDATSYQGVKFKWSIEAHPACILCCRAAPDGVLTSGADKLVKMWSFTGHPLGVLIQSAPSGSKSCLWSLDIDVEPAVERERSELDHIIKQVLELAEDRSRPELAGYDFTGIEPGDFSISFSRSELRQRIEKTSSILGVDFAARSGNMSTSMGIGKGTGTGTGEPSPFSRPSTGLSPLEGDFNLSNNSTWREGEGFGDNFDTSNFNCTDRTGRIFENAITELKSSDAAIDMKERDKGLTKLQLRRKSAKIEEISCAYELKTGIKISLHKGNQSRSSLSKILNKEGVEYRASSSLRTKSGHQKAVKSHKIYVIDNTKLSSSLSSTGPSTVSPNSLDGDGYGFGLGSGSGSVGTPTDSIQLISKMKLNEENEEDEGRGIRSKIRNLDPKSLQNVPSPPRRGRAHSASRSRIITDACNKFSTYQKLESLLTNQTASKKLFPLKPDELEKLKRMKAKKF